MRRRATLVAGVAAAVTAAVAVPATTGAQGASAALVNPGPPSLTYTPSASWWGANGRVSDLRVVGSRVYLAGGFDYIGRTTGYGVRVDAATGGVAAGPKIDGIVRAAVPDGQGGWYVGGDFRKLDTRGRVTLGHITAAGAVSAWNPKTNGVVNAIAVTPNGIAVGGSFTTVNDVAAQNLAMVDATTGALVPGWKSSPNLPVRALAASGSSLFVGGDFTSLNGQSRSRLARVSAATGATETAFAGTAGGTVRALAVNASTGTLYAGGDFTSANGGAGSASRSRLAAYATTTGALSTFAPAANGSVQALALDGAGQVYAGGLFTSIGSTSRERLAQLSPSGAVGALDGALNGCHIRHDKKYAHGLPPCTPEVSALSVSGTTLYVGGRFGASGATERHDAAAFSTTTGALTAWNPVAGDRPLAVAGTASGVFLGGEFTSVGGLVRRGLAALDATTGAGVPEFRADANEYVETMVGSSDGTRLFVGGNFTAIQGKARSYFAAIDMATGIVVDGVAPKFNRSVLTLAYSSGAVYAGGQFTKVTRVARGHAVKLNAMSGAVDTSWVANTNGPSGSLRRNGMVQGIEATPDGLTVFLGGPFTSVNGKSVAGGIAVVSGATGALGPRQLGGVRGCGSIGPWVNRLYLSDDGERLYGGDVCPDDVYQWDAVNLSTPANPTGLKWRTSCNGGMQGRLEVNGHFYYGTHGGDQGEGGRCLDAPGGSWVDQARYYVFNGVDGRLYPDAPDFNTPMGVWAFAATGGGLVVGGDFTFAGTARDVQQGLAFFPGTP
ncbi:MAG TPA: hypothetical protein VIB11_17475 [Pedococcus sp.]|jgi:hypothetical protein|uniref:hypothetical protein n=1 Tax=Pedococcus sp. TaxID=2860345 RepID=UPI002F934C7F